MTQSESQTSSNFLLGLNKIFLKMANLSKKDSHEESELKKLQLAKDMEMKESILKKQNQAQKIIDVGLWKHYFKMIENGYLPTLEQINKVDDKLSEVFVTIEKPLDLLNELISVSYEPSPAIIITLLKKEIIVPSLLKDNNLKEHLEEISQNTNIEAIQIFTCYQSILNSVNKLDFSQYCGKLFLELLLDSYNNIDDIDFSKKNNKNNNNLTLNQEFNIANLANCLNNIKLLTHIFPQQLSSTISLDKLLTHTSLFNNLIETFNLKEKKGINILVKNVQENLKNLINYYSNDLEILYPVIA